MWYILIFASVVLMMFSYRVKKARIRNPRQKSPFNFMGNDTAAILWGCAALGATIALILFAKPSPEKLRGQLASRELAYRRQMASYLATQLKTKLPNGKHAVVVNRRYTTDDAERYQQALLEGLKAGFGEGVTVSEGWFEPAESATETQPIFTYKDLDAILEEHPDCQYLISFIGVPDGYLQSHAAFKAGQQQLAFGVYSKNIYLLGEAIFSGAITLCVVPRRQFQYENTPVPEATAAAFEERYHLISPSTVEQFWRRNRRWLKVARRQRG